MCKRLGLGRGPGWGWNNPGYGYDWGWGYGHIGGPWGRPGYGYGRGPVNRRVITRSPRIPSGGRKLNTVRPLPPYYGGYCGMCSRSTCRETREVLVKKDLRLKLNFRRVTKLKGTEDSEKYTLNFTSENKTLDYNIEAPYFYDVKKRKNRAKIKLK